MINFIEASPAIVVYRKAIFLPPPIRDTPAVDTFPLNCSSHLQSLI